MKKLYTICASMLLTSSAFAATTIWNGDDATTGEAGGWWDRCQPQVVEQDGNKVLQFTVWKEGKGVSQNDWEQNNIARGWDGMGSHKRISFRIKRERMGNIQLALELEGQSEQHLAQWYDTPGEWKTMVYDFNSIVTAEKSTVVKILCHIEDSSVADDATEAVYIDDLQVEDAPTATLNGNVYTLTGFWAKGENSNTNNGWEKVNFDDFTTLKTSADITAVDASQVTFYCYDDQVKAEVEAWFTNPNMLLYASRNFGVANNVVVNGVADNLVLADGYNFAAPTAFTATAASYTRTLAENVFTDVILPFSATSAVSAVSDDDTTDNFVYGTYSSLTKDAVVYAAVDGIAANTPTLVKSETAGEFTFSGAGEIAATESVYGNVLKGGFSATTVENAYLVDGGVLVKKASAEVAPFHLYAQSDNMTASQYSIISSDAAVVDAVAAANDVYASGSTLYIKAVAPATVVVYGIDGREAYRAHVAAGTTAVNSLARGLYIVAGKKVVIR